MGVAHLVYSEPQFLEGRSPPIIGPVRAGMAEKLEVKQTVYYIGKILFKRVLIYFFDDDDPPRYSPQLREDSIRILSVVQHCNDHGHVEAIVVEGKCRPIVDHGHDPINKAEVRKIKGDDVVAAYAELLAENAIPSPYIQDSISWVQIGTYL